jgi:hypothetical protein
VLERMLNQLESAPVHRRKLLVQPGRHGRRTGRLARPRQSPQRPIRPMPRA